MNNYALITRRSEVQILPPQPWKDRISQEIRSFSMLLDSFSDQNLRPGDNLGICANCTKPKTRVLCTWKHLKTREKKKGPSGFQPEKALFSGDSCPRFVILTKELKERLYWAFRRGTSRIGLYFSCLHPFFGLSVLFCDDLYGFLFGDDPGGLKPDKGRAGKFAPLPFLIWNIPMFKSAIPFPPALPVHQTFFRVFRGNSVAAFNVQDGHSFRFSIWPVLFRLIL